MCTYRWRQQINKIYGNTSGISSQQIKTIEALYHKRCAPDSVISADLAQQITAISHQTNRQIGVLITRKGDIAFVIVGTHHQIEIPPLDSYRSASTRFKGLRLVHTHFGDAMLTEDDLTDLALLRLDFICATLVKENGIMGGVFCAHLIPENPEGTYWAGINANNFDGLKINFLSFIQSLEADFSKQALMRRVDVEEKALLISTASKLDATSSLIELRELAMSCGIAVYDTVVQHRINPDPKFVIGKGKLASLIIRAMQIDANLLVFDQELTPAQSRSIAIFSQMKVVDRTQVILDIFARRAHSKEGKIQVELAQLKYLLPRLSEQDTAMSRLTGGIGARGPGETKLEINRRRVRDRIGRLEKELKSSAHSRLQRLAKRHKHNLPIISIVGYTNVGKSTLLNGLTKSAVFAEDMVFATLDTKSARLRLPHEQEVIITDTVGFIRALPKELLSAFRATLDELNDADVLLHVIDVSNPNFENQIVAVENILGQLDLATKPTLRIFNKLDLLPDTLSIDSLCQRFEAIPICAIKPNSFTCLLERLTEIIARKR
ncbi:MAG: GTPase HflX [Deltaproteobacteria bacterium]